jgi:lipoprotein NlpI
MKTKWCIAGFLTVMFIAGCASAPPPTGHPSNMAWYQPGVSAEQTGRDLAASQYYAMVNAGGYSVQGDTVGQTMLLGMFAQSAQQSRENQLIQSRMAALGYSLVKTNSQLLKTGFIPVTEMTPAQNAQVFETWKTKAESGDAGAQFQLGSMYYSGTFGATKDISEAIKWYQKAYDQNYPNMQFPLASAYAKRGFQEAINGDLDGALVDLNKVIEIKPDFTETYAVRGFVKHIKGDFGGAMADFNKDIEMNPKDALVYCARGLLNYDSHKFSDALTDLRKGCEFGLDVTNRDNSHNYIWLIRARLGETDDATKELQTYWNRRESGTPDDWLYKISSFLTGRLAEPDFFKAAENKDSKTDKEQHCEVYFYAASKRLIEGDKTTATNYFKKSVATGCNPFDVDEIISAAEELKSLEINDTNHP